VYGGSNIHPVQTESFPKCLPSLLLSKDLNPLTVQFLAKITDMFQCGTLPSAKLQIPCHLMQWPTWIEPNSFGDIVHYSPLIEMLLHIATHYVNHPMGAYSQLLHRTLPEFNMFEDYCNTCVCPQCKDYGHSDDEDKKEDQDEDRPTWNFLSDPEESEEESSQADSSSRALLESFPIIQPCTNSFQTPPFLSSPCT